MDTKTVESLRAELKALSYPAALAVAELAGLSGATVQKFRMGHISEPRLAKLEALKTAMAKMRRRSKAEAQQVA